MGSGRGVSIREVLDQLIALSDTEIETRVDPQRLRPADIELPGGGHLHVLLPQPVGEPEIPLDRCLADLLDWWRSSVERTEESNSTRP